MDLGMNSNQLLSITLKFGGYWAQVKNQGRRRYDGGKQKTVKFQKDLLSFHVLNDEVRAICQWIRGHNFELFYHICGTSPKEYAFIASDVEVMAMIAQSHINDRIEVVVITQNMIDDAIYLEGEQVQDGSITSNNHHSSSDFIYNDKVELDACRELVVGAQFEDSLAFKQFLRTNSITNNVGVKIQVSNRLRVVAICAHRGCPWRVRAALCKDGHSFEVRTLVPTHLCPGVNIAGNRQATTSWVAKEIGQIVRKNPDIPPKQINNNLENMFGLSLSYMKLWRAREAARENIFGSVEDSYRLVPAFKAELIKRNPGSHIIYNCSKHDGSFKRFFVSFKVSIDGFLIGCRHLIGLDACHLKSKYLGVLLSANSLDGNNGLFTLAFAVAESESKKTWTWFLENLAISLGFELPNIAFISDMEKGLAESIKLTFPNVEHRVCLRHLWKNLKKNFCRHDSQKIASLVWSIAGALTMIEYNASMNELLHISPPIHAYLTNLPYKWAKSSFLPDIRNHYNTNNMSESFNSWISEARSKPAIDLLDMIRGKLMDQRAERKANSMTWKGVLVPYAEEHIRDITTTKEQFIIRHSTPQRVEVESCSERFEIDMESRVCTCRRWQLSGLPCIHAAAVIGIKELPLWHTFVDETYYVTRYRMAYEGSISTLSGKETWTEVEDVPTVGIPNTLRPRGRPKKKRVKSFLEHKGSKEKNVHKCSRCGSWGHHKTSCKNPLSQTSSQQLEGGSSMGVMPDIDRDAFISQFSYSGVGSRGKLPVRRERSGSAFEI